MKGSVNVPLFVNDDDTSVTTLLKQAAAFGTGGWWAGGGHMKINPCAPAPPVRRGGRGR